jgi:hypothetical protein
MGMDSSVFDIAVSSDGEHILLSSYRYKDALATAVVTEYDTLNGRASGRKWEHLARGQYFRDGVLGIASNLHNTNIVYRNAAGNEEVLLRGNEELIYTTPYSINETWIVYVRAVKGRRELCMFNYETKKEYVLKSNLEDDVLRWKYIRNLRVSGDKIFFVYNHDDRMYKLGVIDISAFQNENSAMNVIFTSTDFSGGIFLPALLDETIYYRGFFSEQDKLMQFPETINMISGIKAEINLVLSDKNNPEIFSSEKNNIADENTSVSKPYIGLAYMNPFNYWIPFLPLIRTTESFVSLDGWGLMSIMTDPTDTNMITLSAIGDWKAKMADIAIDWNSYYLGFPVTFSFSDGVDSMLAGNSYRQTRASLSGVYSRSIGNERNYVSIVPGIDFAAYANNPFNNSSAYTWSYADTIFSGALGVGWSNMYRYAWQLFGTGMSVNVYYRTPFDFTQTRIDSTINIAMEKIFPLRFQFYGAWDTRGMNLQGSSGAYASYFSAFASNEYSSPNGLNAEWLAGGQAELKLFGIEIQKNLSHIYFNRVYTSLAYRGVVYDGQGIVDAEGNHLYEDLLLAQSLVLRLGLEFSLIPIKSAPLKFIPNVWGAWKISNMNDGKENDFYVNFGFELAL